MQGKNGKDLQFYPKARNFYAFFTNFCTDFEHSHEKTPVFLSFFPYLMVDFSRFFPNLPLFFPTKTPIFLPFWAKDLIFVQSAHIKYNFDGFFREMQRNFQNLSKKCEQRFAFFQKV